LGSGLPQSTFVTKIEQITEILPNLAFAKIKQKIKDNQNICKKTKHEKAGPKEFFLSILFLNMPKVYQFLFFSSVFIS